MREICLDTETTGLDPRDGHKVIEIAAFEIIDKVKTGNYFHCYINPNRNVPHEAFLIHGISTEFLLDKPNFSQIVNDFLTFIKNDPLIIHNAVFDLKFLNFELNSIGSPLLTQNKIIDTLSLARQKFPNSPNSLDALCKRFNVDLSKRDKHGALLDSELLAQVYLELLGGRQRSLGLIETQEETLIEIEEITTVYPVRVFEISEEEKSKHREFLSQLKSPLWANILGN